MRKILIAIFTAKSLFLLAQTTTFSGSYGLTGYNLDQPEIQFNLETSYEGNSEKFSQLYRWRYAMGDFKCLIFEYNNRFYFSNNQDYDNSKWYLQGKVGYGMLKGKAQLPGSVYWNDPVTGDFMQNMDIILDNRHINLNYGLALGYKFILFDRLTFDLYTGYNGFIKPKFTNAIEASNVLRRNQFSDGIGCPIEFQWSLGFFLD